MRKTENTAEMGGKRNSLRESLFCVGGFGGGKSHVLSGKGIYVVGDTFARYNRSNLEGNRCFRHMGKEDWDSLKVH